MNNRSVRITNRRVDLSPVLSQIAERFQLKYALLQTGGDDVTTTYSEWVLLSFDEQFLKSLLTPATLARSPLCKRT
jgi:hypothetical protein